MTKKKRPQEVRADITLSFPKDKETVSFQIILSSFGFDERDDEITITGKLTSDILLKGQK